MDQSDLDEIIGKLPYAGTYDCDRYRGYIPYSNKCVIFQKQWIYIEPYGRFAIWVIKEICNL